MSRIHQIILKLRETLLQVIDKENPALYELAMLEVCESHDRLEEKLTKANKRIKALQAGSRPSLREN